MPKMPFTTETLLPVVSDLMNITRELTARDKDKACEFVAHLVANGGNKTKAALDAGFGETADKKGVKPKTEEQKIASARNMACDLLKNPSVKLVYDQLFEQKFAGNILRKLITKDHMIYLYYAVFHHYWLDDKKCGHALTALNEICKLEGYHLPDANTSDEEAKRLLAQFLESKKVLGHMQEIDESNLQLAPKH